MKKLWRICSCFILALAMLFLTAEPALAYTEKKVYTTKSLEAGTIVSGEQGKYTYNSTTKVYTYKYYIYKITLPSDGYILITNYKSANYCSVSVYKTLTAAKEDNDAYVYSGWEKTMRIPLKAGTYYLRGGGTYGAYKFKYTVKAVNIDPGNYCKAKAKTLSSGTTTTICVPDGYQYYRWYKAKTTTKKTLVVTFKNLMDTDITDYPDFYVYDSSGTKINMVHGDGYIYKSAKTLPVGTYYIRVNAVQSYSSTDLFLYTLSWK